MKQITEAQTILVMLMIDHYEKTRILTDFDKMYLEELKQTLRSRTE